MTAPLRIWELLKALAGADVKFFVIGGVAVGAYGYERATKDVDVIPAPDPENLQRLYEVLGSLDAESLDVGDFRPEEMPYPFSPEALQQGGNWFLTTRHGRLDLLQYIEGILDDEHPYEELERGTLELDTPVGPIRIVGYEDLLRMKYAAGRELDLIDIRALREARGELE